MSGSSVIYPGIGEGPLIVPSTFGYASGYKKSKKLVEQLGTLYRLFPSLSHEPLIVPISTRTAPDFTEGWFVVPHWSLVAETYTHAVLTAIERLKTARGCKVHQYCFGKIRGNNLRRNIRAERALKATHKGDGKVSTIPAQFGIRHRGASSHWVKRTFMENEFGLGLFEGIVMLITHPERLMSNDDLWIEFPGDSFAYESGKDPLRTPFLNIIDGEIGVGTVSTNVPGARFGSATWLQP